MERIELEPLVSHPAAPAPPRRVRLGGLAVGVAVAATLATGLAVVVRPDRIGPPAGQSPAALSASVLSNSAAVVEVRSAPRSTRFESAYAACMSDVGGSPDARERWVEACRRQADEMLHDERIYAACMRSAGGTPDSMERHATECRQRADIDSP